MAEGLVDWGVARRLAGAIAGEPRNAEISHRAAQAACDEGLRRVLAYTGLEPRSPIPAAELVDRRQWSLNALGGLAEMTGPLEGRAGELQLPGPLGALARRGLGAAIGAEAGAITGYASRRVIGQYDVALAPGGGERASRLLLVEANLTGAARELEADTELFLLWIAIHELTHAVQFTAVPWLRDHMSSLLERLLRASTANLDAKALLTLARRVASSDPRKSLRAALQGDLIRSLAGSEQAALFEELQAAMTVIEGYAEHVMDAAAADHPGLGELRPKLEERRRRRRNGFGDAIARALGMGIKMRQYELGKAFCDGIASERGIAALNEVWKRPGALPTLAELEDPASWQAVAAGAA